MDQRTLHREALGDLDSLLTDITPTDLARPTPCEGWTLADLLAHELGQHVGFAAAVREGDAPPSAYAPVPFTAAAWRESVTALLEAFAAADLDARVVEIEFTPRPLPVRVLVGAQLLDAAVHGWDVAAALGREYTPSDAVVDAVAEVAFGIADDDARSSAGFFGPAVTMDGGAWPRVLAHLGRDPGWQPPA